MATISSVTSVFSRPALPNRFEIIKILGDGAAGVVYKVKDNLRKGEIVALKVLSNSGAFDEHTLARFNKELEIARSIESPHVVQAYELIEFEDTVAFTMEFVPGSDLGMLCRQKKLSVPEVRSIIIQVLRGLEALHQKGVLHRDIKLENVLVRDDAVVKISDLGLLKQTTNKMTRTGILLGTAQYLPPEYIRGSEYDARGDIYTVGLIALELLCGRRWLDDKSGNQAIDHLLKTNFKIPQEYWNGIPDAIRIIVERATALNPLNRYQSAKEMREALEKISEKRFASNQSGVRIHPNMCSMGTIRKKMPSSGKKNKLLVGIAVACVSLLLVAIIFGFLAGPTMSRFQTSSESSGDEQPSIELVEEAPVALPTQEFSGELEIGEGKSAKSIPLSAILKGQRVVMTLPIQGCDLVEIPVNITASGYITATQVRCQKKGLTVHIDEASESGFKGVVVDREKSKVSRWWLNPIGQNASSKDVTKNKKN